MSFIYIALNTFREAVRDKFLYLLMGFALLLILVARAVGWVSAGLDNKVTTDLGLFAIWLFSALVSILIGTGMIYKEIDKRTLYTILSKPIARWEFVLGKYIGLLLTSTVSLVGLSLAFLIYLKALGSPIDWAILQAIVLTFFEIVMVTALAILFSSASTPILSAIFTFMLFAVGQLTQWLVDFSTVVKTGSALTTRLLDGVYLLLPNLNNFNIRQQAVHATSLGKTFAIPPDQMLAAILYSLSYTAAVLLLAVLVFRRRNF